MSFNRRPRIQVPLPREPVDVPEPSALPAEPAAFNGLLLALPLAAVLLTVLLLGGGGSRLAFAPLLLVGAGATGLTHVWSRRDHRRQLDGVKRAYQAALAAVERRLQSLQRDQRQILLALHPEPDECVQRAEAGDVRLGERRPADGDFLRLRVGLGRVPASCDVRPPNADPQELAALQDEIDRARGLARDYSWVPSAPRTIEITRVGSIGLAGDREPVLDLARALVAQIVVHHWPSEVRVTACAEAGSADWAWLNDLPHAMPEFMGREAQACLSALETELERRAEWLAVERNNGERRPEAALPWPHLVILFDGPSGALTHPALMRLRRDGRDLGVHGIFLVERSGQVPGECGAVIEVRGQRFSGWETGPEGRRLEGRPDALDESMADRLAEALDKIEWPPLAGQCGPPDQVGLLELFGVASPSELPIERWWDGEPPHGYLRTAIGRTSPSADLIFDLNDRDGGHGPHGLIGGMTGSGKSEVLRTLLLALAVAHHPYDLNFALIDYKGGAAFGDLARLPHTVGVITDIESHAGYAERVILALTGELERRKRVLQAARTALGPSSDLAHVDEYRRLLVKRPLPRLVIAFDEFAEFKQHHPDECRRLISIARLGRSLGMHLILATQNLAAAIDPQILQNAAFRICLRVSDPQEGAQMAGAPEAVGLGPGRAYLRDAGGRRLFQVAFGGRPSVGNGSGQTTEAAELIERICAAARQAGLKPAARVWPDPLPERLVLPELIQRFVDGGWNGRTWCTCRVVDGSEGGSPAFLGLCDDPVHQRQDVLCLDPARGNGHLLVFGAAGSGKSTLLRTLVTSLAHCHSPQSVHVYAFDFGGRSALKALEGLPHVGAVVSRFEPERAERLMGLLRDELARRNELFRRAQVDGLETYNMSVTPETELPRIVLLIDGFAEFKRLSSVDVVREVVSMVGGGQSYGLSLVVAANLPSEVPADLLANVPERVTFAQPDTAEVLRAIGRLSESRLKEDPAGWPAGRGWRRGVPPLEFQAALPTAADVESDQAHVLMALGQAMDRAWTGPRPAPVRCLPMLVTLPEQGEGQPVGRPFEAMLGQAHTDLSHVGLALEEDGPMFLVLGANPRSGKTTLLSTWVLGLAERYSPADLQFVFIDFHSRSMSAFRHLPHCLDYVSTPAAFAAALDRVEAEVERRREQVEVNTAQSIVADTCAATAGWPRLVVVIDEYHALAARAEDERRRLGKCLPHGSELGVFALLGGNAAEMPRDYDDGLIARARRHGCGVLLGGSQGIEQFNNARAVGAPAGLEGIPGRGYLVRRGRASLMQAAAYWNSTELPREALERRVKRICKSHATNHLGNRSTT